MKRVCIVFAVVLLLASLAPCAFAAGSASLSGPSVIRAGDTITLTFSAGGGILGGSGTLSYDPAQLTLQKTAQAIGGSWAVEFNGSKFVFYDNNMSSPINGSAAIFKVTFKVNENLPAGTVVNVSTTGVTLSDGTQDMGVGTQTYSKTVAPPLSGNCDLSALTVSNATISPAFSPNVTKYTAKVPFSVSALNLSAAAADANAKVSVSNPKLAAAATTSVTVTVTAENGTVKKYTIQVTRAQDPNYVPSSNADLSELSVDGFRLSPGFGANVKQYYVWVPYETDSVKVSGTAADKKAKVAISQQPLTPGKATDIAVTVTAENGTTQQYILSVFRGPAHEDMDRFLNGETEPTTQPTTLPETVPTTVPETSPTTEPSAAPQPSDNSDPKAPSALLLLLVGVLCAAAGAAVGILGKSMVGSKHKHRF